MAEGFELIEGGSVTSPQGVSSRGRVRRTEDSGRGRSGPGYARLGPYGERRRYVQHEQDTLAFGYG